MQNLVEANSPISLNFFFCQKTVFAKIPLMLGSGVSGNFDGEDITKSKDEGIMKRIKENGEGFDHPNVS